MLLQAIPDERVEFFAQGIVFHAVDDLAGEGVDQHAARVLQPDASAAQIVNRFVVELADGRAVRAFHIVGIDLELWLRVGGGVVGEQQVLVRLLGVGLLRVRPDEDASVDRKASCRERV